MRKMPFKKYNEIDVAGIHIASNTEDLKDMIKTIDKILKKHGSMFGACGEIPKEMFG